MKQLKLPFGKNLSDRALAFQRPGRARVSVFREDWFDESRGRKVPVKIHIPASGTGPFPVVVFSHGLAGSREGYAYLGRHWASHGILVVHAQHAGTDKRILTGKLDVALAMRDAVKTAENLLNRPMDIRFCIDRALGLSGDPRSSLRGMIDPGRIAVAGHSMGATTALACAGRRLPGRDGESVDFSDPRVRACIAMSPSSGDLESSRRDYAGFAVPCLHMTGTRDASPIGRTEIRNRRVPFDSILRNDQILLIFKDGDHMIFSDHRIRPNAGRERRPFLSWIRRPGSRGEDASDAGARDPVYHRAIRMVTAAFWDAVLKGNEGSQKWLYDGGLKKALEGMASMETHKESMEEFRNES
jgi:pimeloyl-ACP methyl ester carboxylesterase